MHIEFDENNMVDEKNAFATAWKLVTYFDNFEGARKILDYLPDRHATNKAFKRCALEWAQRKDFYKATKFAQLSGHHRDAAYMECTYIFLDHNMLKEAKWCAELSGSFKEEALQLVQGPKNWNMFTINR